MAAVQKVFAGQQKNNKDETKLRPEKPLLSMIFKAQLRIGSAAIQHNT